MKSLRFNHVFAGLLLISVACAFVISPRFTNPVRGQVQGIFYPVAKPTRALSQAVFGRFQRADEVDPRNDKDIRRENQQLRAALAELSKEVEQLQTIAADYESVGDIAKYCTRVSVIGNAPSNRDSLSLQGSFAGTMVDCPVLYEQSVVGKIERAGIGGAQVRLITDRGMSTSAQFRRFVGDARGVTRFDYIETKKMPVVDGNGDSTMIIRNLPMADVKEIKPGDWVVLDDTQWDSRLQKRRLGIVKQIRPLANAALFAEILVHPEWDLRALRDVMVMNKTGEETSNEHARNPNK